MIMVPTCLRVRFVSLLVLVLASQQSIAIADDSPRQEPTDQYGDPLPPGAVARLGTLRLRHLGRVHKVAITPDDKILASAGEDDLIRFWDLTTGRPIRLLAGHTGPVHAIAFSADGKVTASASWDRTVRLWDVATGKEISRPISALANFVAFTPKGRLLAFDERRQTDGSATRHRLWDCVEGKEVRSWEAPNYTLAAAFSPDGKILATGGGDGVHLWELATGKEVRRCNAIRGVVTCLAFAPDGKSFASGSGGQEKLKNFGEIKIWDAINGKELCNLPTERPVSSLDYTPDGRMLVTGESLGKTVFWDLANKDHPRQVWEDGIAGRSSALTHDGRLLARSKDLAVQILDVATRTSRLPHAGHTAEIRFVEFCPDSRTVVSVGENIRLWDAVTGKERRALPNLTHSGGAPGPYCAALTPDGKALVTGSNEGTIVWDLSNGKQLRTFLLDHGYAVRAAITPDGKTLITEMQLRTQFVDDKGRHVTQERYEEFLRAWDLATGKEIPEFEKARFISSPLVFSPNGTPLVSKADNGAIQLSDIATGKRFSMKGPKSTGWFPNAPSFSPDGKLLASVDSENKIEIWDFASGQEVCRLRVHRSQVKATALSPDGKMLVSAGADRTIRLWDVATGKSLHEIYGHQDEVLAIAFSPDGKRIASASADTTVLIWDIVVLGKVASRLIFRPTLEELNISWIGLGADYRVSNRSIHLLLGAPGLAVPFLKQRLSQESPHKEQISRLIDRLDSDSFQVREEASKELEKLGESAVPALLRMLANTDSIEARSRAERLLKVLQRRQARGRVEESDQLRLIRALSVLAQIRTPEANKALPSAATNSDLLLPIDGDKRRRISNELERAWDGAVRLLETNATPEARQVLKVVVASALDDRVRRQAKEALERLGHNTNKDSNR
jgi:WD40 repeat protein